MRIVFLILLHLSLASYGQMAIPLPAPLNSPGNDWNSVMLPDSSVMVASSWNKNRNDDRTWLVYRYEYKKGSWVLAPSQLDSLISSLIVSEGIPNFRFSGDFTRIFVTIYTNDETRFYESNLVDGRWSLFSEILQGNPAGLWHALTVSDDYTSLYGTSRKGDLYVMNRTAIGWGDPQKVTAFDKLFDRIEDPICVGHDGLLFQGFYKPKARAKKGEHIDDRNFFFSRKHSDGTWTAPSKVEGLFGSHVFINPSLTHFLFSDVLGKENGPGRQGVGYAPLPPFLRKELSRSATRAEPPKQPVAVAKPEPKPGGRYYALLIGNSNYRLDKLDLDRPANDLRALSDLLMRSYNFEKEDMIQLVDADRSTIISELFRLRAKINPTDNLLIFYAGHGYYDKAVRQGYWWPVDADPVNPATWISNSDLREQIRGLNTKHTLLISDACFSGGIFKTRGPDELRQASLDVLQLYHLPSRRAITSGTMSTVPDESVFFRFLTKYLSENQDKYISSGQLFASIRRAVLSNSTTIPQDGVIMDAGDEGGDFIFIRR